MTVTVAPGTTARLESRMVPLIVPKTPRRPAADKVELRLYQV
jgi:hypothetical protein